MFAPNKKESLAPDNFYKTEESAFNDFTSDGSSQVTGGLNLLTLALVIAIWPGKGIEQGMVWFPMLAIFIGLSIYWKRRITYPRIGYFRINKNKWPIKMSPFGKKLQGGMFLAFTVSTIVYCYAFILAANYSPYAVQAPYREGDIPGFEQFMWAFFLAGEFASRDLMAGRRKALLVWLLGLIIVAATGYLNIFPSWILAPIGIYLLIMGLQRTRCFLREHPLPEIADAV